MNNAAIITLSALEPEDLELLYTIENDTTLWNVGSANVPYSRYALRDYIAGQQHDIYADKQLRLVIRVGEGDSVHAVGLIDLFNFSPDHLRAEMGIAILRSEQGKGYAVTAIQQLKDYCHNTLHLHQIYCIVPANNAPSLSMLRATGFSDEKTLSDWLLTSEGWQDAIITFCKFK